MILFEQCISIRRGNENQHYDISMLQICTDVMINATLPQIFTLETGKVILSREKKAYRQIVSTTHTIGISDMYASGIQIIYMISIIISLLFLDVSFESLRNSSSIIGLRTSEMLSVYFNQDLASSNYIYTWSKFLQNYDGGYVYDYIGIITKF